MSRIGNTSDTDTPKSSSRRAFISAGLEKVVQPIAIALIAGYAGAYFAQRNEKRHLVSISVIRSDSAAPPKDVDPFLAALAPDPTPTPIPEEEPVYTYTALVRNNGDFPEDEVTISVSFQGDSQDVAPLTGPQIDASSSLLAKTITGADPLEPPPSYALAVPRLNPGEWVSLKTSWKLAMDAKVDVRSAQIAESSR